MSDTLEARKEAIEEQLIQMDGERCDVLVGIVHRMIEGGNIKEDEQLYYTLERLMPLSMQEINGVIEVLNLETRMVMSRMLFNVDYKPEKPIDWKDAVQYRPHLEVK